MSDPTGDVDPLANFVPLAPTQAQMKPHKQMMVPSFDRALDNSSGTDPDDTSSLIFTSKPPPLRSGISFATKIAASRFHATGPKYLTISSTPATNSDDEFGDFVDPLSGTSADVGFSPIEARGRPLLSPRKSHRNDNASNDPSGSYFETIPPARQETGAGETYLEELMKHDQNLHSWVVSSRTPSIGQKTKTENGDEIKEGIDLLGDLDDHAFMTPRIYTHTQSSSSIDIPILSRSPKSRASESSPPLAMRRSSSSMSPSSARLAMPQLSTQVSQSYIPEPQNETSWSPSGSGSGSVSTRWMSTLMRANTETTRQSAQRMFEADHVEKISRASFPQQSKTEDINSDHVRYSSLSTSRLSHGPSPFASKVPYVPPSGAPGFGGDENSQRWDKGFSDELAVLSDQGNGRISVADSLSRVSGDVILHGRNAGSVSVLDLDLSRKIRNQFPALARLPRTWSLLYSLDQHGISLQTLYTRCEASNTSALVAVRDDNEACFGVWLGEPLRMCKGSYYGGGEAFLWKHHQGKFETFKWSGKNDYVALCEPEFLSFGGGDGNYGLYLDSNLIDGSSAPCPTFHNSPLCAIPTSKKASGASVKFECVGLEVWAVGS